MARTRSSILCLWCGLAAASPDTQSECTEGVDDTHSFIQTASGAVRTVSCHQLINAPDGTNCPNAKWVDAMVLADPSPGKVIMSIGCNKGNDLIAWMERWDMSETHFWSAQKWRDYYKNDLSVDNYACPISESPLVTARQAHSAIAAYPDAFPTGVCVEPMVGNYDLLRRASSTFGYGAKTEFGSLHVVHAAILDKAAANQTIDFALGSPGQENVGVSFLQMPVPLKTVDGLVADLDLPRVDILLIDTEGADPAVLRGAASTLAYVRYLEFEVHRDLTSTEWGHTTLRSVVESLSQQDFECYWAGNNAKLLSMNKCWTDSFERGAWANAACVKRSDPWSEVLKRFATP